MRYVRLILIQLFITHAFIPTAQNIIKPHKGSFYIYWGWNFDTYSKSNIRFKGSDHNFTIKHVRAKDRPTHFSVDAYFNPSNLSTPQYNYRMGYYLTNRTAVSIGMDHMKYVMTQNQIARIYGDIQTGSKYDGLYSGESIALTSDFLRYEHTNGLNYLNMDIRRQYPIWSKAQTSLNIQAGLGAGVLIPRTDAALLNKDEYDEFHLAGYGIAPLLGFNFTFFKRYFLQSEYKVGWVNLPDVRTTNIHSDKASQQFMFGQLNFVFGAYLK